MRFIGRVGPEDSAHRQPRNAHGNALVLRLALGQSHMGELRIGEHAVRHQAVARTAIPPGQIVLDDPKVVDGYVREQRAAGTLSDRPHIGRGRLQPLIDANVTAIIQFDPGLVEADPGSVRNPPCRDQDVAACDLLFAGGRTRYNIDLFARAAASSTP